MKRSILLGSLLLSACATQGTIAPPPPNMVVTYHDLALDTPSGRAELVERVDRATRYFCAAYDPQDETAIFDARLANARQCPGYATLLLMSKAPASVRRAYRKGLAKE